MLIVEDMGWGQHCMENYKKLGIDVPAEIITPEEARERFPIYKDADWSGLKQAFWNPTSGWADAASALRDVIQAAIDEGVEYLKATVSTLSFDQKGGCIGLRTADGTELRADNIVLCTGPYTAKLIADSAPERQELQVDGRMVAAGAVSGAAIFDPTEAEKFHKVPVCINTLEPTHGQTQNIPCGVFGLLTSVAR
jgi:sarcosine oxidase/L-pipecolate oxidase